MDKILLIGNGFDLAHGLNTSYDDFLFLMQNWTSFIGHYDSLKKGGKLPEGSRYARYLTNIDKMNKDNLDKLGRIITHNSWVKYYCKCEAEIDGWIDFEKEIIPVINLFSIICSSRDFQIITHGETKTDAYFSKGIFSSKDIGTAKLFERYFKTDNINVTVKYPFVSKNYGILKKKILRYLHNEFDDFILAFELYLLEFVHTNDNINLLKQIKAIDANYVISFNYTWTFQLYDIEYENVHPIHGLIREDITLDYNDMVMGINEQENQNMDFIYFVKYFRRIQKHSGVKYKDFVSPIRINGETCAADYTLYIYGHSLDQTDEDILRYLIGNVDETGKLILRPRKVVIYYYDTEDYEQKVINLINLYNRDIVERAIENNKFLLLLTDDEIWIETQQS